MAVDDMSQFFANRRETPSEAFDGVEEFASPLVPVGTEDVHYTEDGARRSALYPSPDLMRGLSEADNRIEFLPADFSRQDTLNVSGGYNATEADYNLFVSRPVAEHMEKFLKESGLQPKDIRIRVSPIALNGGIVSRKNDLYVRDIRQVLKLGSDRYPDKIVTAAGFGAREGTPTLHEHVNNAAYSQPISLRDRLSKAGLSEKSHGVFPVLCVYAADKLASIGGYSYERKSDDAILKAFVLPILTS
jgi:hypothetical protein